MGEKCEAIVVEPGGMGWVRHCSFAAKWTVDGVAYCSIHKNVELRMDPRNRKVVELIKG